ncbi:hypothetical protein EsDP_00003407 [Epichloe bromicola]|uniref:Uncharacterized protein n=1 Tax=Epichloe bromicola TaxID=79588 RepID=A0ABQ0CNP5_9HYPO
MISRAAQLPRICLVCRLGMSQRAIASPIRYPPRLDGRPQRRLASDFSPRSKERIEALISGGALDATESDSKSKRPTRKRRGHWKGKGRPRGKDEEELAAWEIEPTQDSEVAHLGEGRNSEVSETLVENNILPETVREGDEITPLPSNPKTNPNAKTFRHDLVNRQSLGVDALGKPVEAIIIKNPNRLKRPSKPIPLSEDERTGTGIPLDWQSIFPRESDASDVSDEVWQNIEEIRPRDATVVRRVDFDKMVARLVDGFTQEQLVTYLNRGKWDDVWEGENSPGYPWILKQSPWIAAQPNQWGALKRKQQQAVMILSVKWKVDIQEHIEGLGRTVVWLQPTVFQLITRPSSGIVERLSNDFLDRSNKAERISTRPDECKLGIYTAKSTVTTILNRLDEIVHTIKSQTTSVEQVESENLTEPVLDELARITNTALQYDPERSELCISWLAESDLSTGQVEGPADIVLRLLVGRQTAPHATQIHVIPGTKYSKSKKSLFLTHQREKRGMSWRDKLRQWHRLVNPIGRPVDTMNRALNLSKRVAVAQPEAVVADERAEVVATFGHILHTEPSVRAVRSGKTRRILSPRVPHPAALTLVTADAEISSAQKTAIVLHFASDDSAKSSSSIAIPQVRLRMPVNPFTDLSSFSLPDTAVLEAVIPWRQTDILLPGESVDVRLTQTRLLPLDSGQASLQNFLNASQFNLLQGELRTPSRTMFPIPNKWLSAGSSAAPLDETTDVAYMFMGLEIHQSIAVEWQGHTLRYSSIEAGHHGGQQQRLSLVSGTHQDDSSIVAQGKLAGFLKLVGETASGAHFSWDEGYKLMQERSHEQFSWDMMDTDEDTSGPGPEEDDVDGLDANHDDARHHVEVSGSKTGEDAAEPNVEDGVREGEEDHASFTRHFPAVNVPSDKT